MEPTAKIKALHNNLRKMEQMYIRITEWRAGTAVWYADYHRFFNAFSRYLIARDVLREKSRYSYYTTIPKNYPVPEYVPVDLLKAVRRDYPRVDQWYREREVDI